MSEPVTRARVGGRHLPPREGLTGRAGACRILQCDKRKLRRMEREGIVKPTLVEPDGVRWFDIETVRQLAAAMQKAVNRQGKRSPRRPLPPNVQRCTGPETRQINDWIAAGVDHAEIVSRSGKTNETIRYLYAQFITPHGRKLRTTSRDTVANEEGYYPERRLPSPQGRPAPAVRSPTPAPQAFPPRSPVPAEWFDDRPTKDRAGSPQPDRQRTEVPAVWFDDKKPPGSRTGNE